MSGRNELYAAYWEVLLGGDKARKATKAQVKKAVHQHEAKMHKGESKTRLKLGRKR